MTLRALIVDDEPVARRRLRRLLRDIPGVEIAGESGDGRSAVADINALAPDVVLLDVQMPEMDGFAVVQALGRDRAPAIVFVTAFDRHALRAFEVHAVDFLLKPVTAGRLAAAMEEVRARLADRRGAGLDPRLMALLDEIAGSRRFLIRLPVKLRGKVVIVDLADVDWIEAADNYVTLHAGATSYLARETLTRLERELDPARFVRIHRSTIVQIDRIKELLPDFHGDFTVVLRDATRVALSRTYRRNVEQALIATRPAGRRPPSSAGRPSAVRHALSTTRSASRSRL